VFYIVSLYILVLSITALHLEAMADSVPPLKCVTFNLLHGGVFSGLVGNGQHLERRLEMIVEEFRALDADIIGLQEASVSRGRGNIAERLADQLGFHWVYAPAHFHLFSSKTLNAITTWVMNFTEGPAIVSRFPIVASQAYGLPRCGRWTDARVLLCAELQTPWGPLQACSTHISGNLCQARGIMEILRDRRSSAPVLLMGDMNALEDSPAVLLFTQEMGFIDTFRAANPTAPGFTVWQRVYAARPMVSRRVDYLFFSPGSDFSGEVLSSRLVFNTPRPLQDGSVLWPSDHYGVLSELAVFAPPA
jgi:endonuclease/exonuclease/phosphatase family metal-dependent hydrolase